MAPPMTTTPPDRLGRPAFARLVGSPVPGRSSASSMLTGAAPPVVTPYDRGRMAMAFPTDPLSTYVRVINASRFHESVPSAVGSTWATSRRSAIQSVDSSRR